MPCIPARRDLFTGRLNFLETRWGPLELRDDLLPDIVREQLGTYSHMITDHPHYFNGGAGDRYHNIFDSWEYMRGQPWDPWRGVVNPDHMPGILLWRYLSASAHRELGVSGIYSVLSWLYHVDYATSHVYHHQYTLYPDADRENLLASVPRRDCSVGYGSSRSIFPAGREGLLAPAGSFRPFSPIRELPSDFARDHPRQVSSGSIRFTRINPKLPEPSPTIFRSQSRCSLRGRRCAGFGGFSRKTLRISTM